MSVLIGHASISENGNAGWDGRAAAGDQTGREVCTRSWYNKPWTCVIRPKDATVAEKMAVAMEQACANNHIGYDQSQRTTLFTQAKNHNWDLSKITTNCETDCSALVAVCVNAAGISVSKDMYTGNEKAVLLNTNKFEAFTDSKYVADSAYLKRGDVLLASGHTAIVLSNGAMVTTTSTSTQTAKKTSVEATESASNFLASLAGKYTTTANLNVRNGAGVTNKSGSTNKILVTIPKGTSVRNYGYYNISGSTKWLLVQFTYKDVTYTGYCSSAYLKKG